MKLYHAVILFLILFCGLAVIHRQEDRLGGADRRRERWFQDCLETAVDAAAAELMFREDGTLLVEQDAVLTSFLQTLYAGLGIMDQPELQRTVKRHVPVLLIADGEGYVLWHQKEEQKDGQLQRTSAWSERMEFGTGGKAACLSEVLQKTLEEYCEDCGIVQSYRFFLPEDDAGLWQRGIDQPGVFVLLQDFFPGREQSGNAYFAFAGAVIYKKDAL